MRLRSTRHVPCCLLLVASLTCAQVTAPPVSAPPPSKKDAKKAAKLFKSGSKDLAANKLPKAESELEQAVQLDPTRIQYQATLDLTRSHMVTNLVRAAEKDRAAGNNAAAADKLHQAHQLDPENPMVKTLMAAMSQAIVAAKEDAGPIAIIRGKSVTLHPRDVRQSFHSRGLPTQLVREVLLAYGVTAIMDDSVPHTSIRVDLDDATYPEASEALKLLTGTFFVPLDETHVIVAKDSPEKRAQLDRILVEDIKLPGTPAAELADLTNLLKSLFDLKQVFTSADRAEISIRGTEAQLDRVNKTIADLAAGKGQVLLDIRLYQINKQRTTNIGLQLPQSETLFNVPAEVRNLVNQNPSLVAQLVSAGLVNPNDFAAIAALLVANGLAGSSILAQPFGVFGGGLTLTGYTLGQATLNLKLNQSETRELDTVQLRLADQDTATLRSGTRYPIITGSYSNLAASTTLPTALLGALGTPASSVSSTTPAAPPQIQYEDLGLTLKATPRLGRDGIIHISIDFKILSLTGQAANGIPVLTSRQFTSNASAKDGDSVMLISTLSRQESRALSGIPGFSEIPGTNLNTNHQREFDTTDLVLVMTPHIVRKTHTEMSAPMITIEPHS